MHGPTFLRVIYQSSFKIEVFVVLLLKQL